MRRFRLGWIMAMAVAGSVALAQAPAGAPKAEKQDHKRGPRLWELEKIEGTALSLKARTGETRTVQVGNTTEIAQSVESDLASLKAGEEVRIWGDKPEGGAFQGKRIIVTSDQPPKGHERKGEKGPEILAGTVESTEPLKVKDEAGQTVEVSLAPDVKVQRSEPLTLDKLAVGDVLMIKGKPEAPQADMILRVPKEAMDEPKPRKDKPVKKAAQP